MRISLYRTLSLRYLQQRWTRALLVIASIALGVATMVATRALNQSMSTAAQKTSDPMTGIADLHVSNGDSDVRLDLKSEIAAVPGVDAVMPLLIERVVLPDLDNRRAVLVGVELGFDNLQSNRWGIKYSVPPEEVRRFWELGRKATLVGKELAAALKAKLPAGSQSFQIKARGESRSIPLWVGTVEAEGAAGVLGGDVLYMDAHHAGEMVGKKDFVSRLDLLLKPDADRAAVKAAVEKVLGDRALVRTPESQEETFQEAMKSLQIGFSMCGT
ncbi:MAG: ABC transporter permease, partial [Gemmataceae bacterium]